MKRSRAAAAIRRGEAHSCACSATRPALANIGDLEVCIVGSALLDLARPWIIGFQLFDLVIRKQDLSRLPFVICC